MNCNELTELLSEYWDLSEKDIRRISADRHLDSCEACREEFDIWQESTSLIQSSKELQPSVAMSNPISLEVMNRIYQNESWRLPITFKSYTFSYKVRRNIMATFALFLTLFIVSFINSLTNGTTTSSDFTELTGIIDTAQADTITVDGKPAMFDGIPVASISAPTILRMGPIQTYTDYLLALSILGFVFTLLIMNWLSRLRA